MNKKTRKLFTWCLVVAMIVTQMLFANVAFAAERYSGGDRYATALKVAAEGWDEAKTVILTRGDGNNLADALAAAPLAGVNDAPILLTSPTALPNGLLDTLADLKTEKVYIVGGTSAVSADIEAELKAADLEVVRVKGDNRYLTSLAVAEEAFGDDFDTAVIASGESFADALSVSAVAAANGMPILLASKNAIDPKIAAYIDGKDVYAVGGTGVLSDTVVGDAERLFGADRYETAAAILGAFDFDYNTVYVAYGANANLVDALAGSALAARTGSPLVLAGETLNGKVEDVLADNLTADSKIVALGGKVSDAVVGDVEDLVPVVDELTATVSATGAKKLTVAFNNAVDTAKAAITVKKGTVAVNTDSVVFADDKKSAVVTTTTKLTAGDYTVTVSGLTDPALTGTVTVTDEKVAKINVVGAKAPRLSGDKTALVRYEVLNQYGEKMNATAMGTSIVWTISTGVSASSDTNTNGNGSFVITAAGGADFIPGSIVYITGVHAASGTVVNAQVEIALASQEDSVVFKGIYDTTKAVLTDLPAGFTSGRYQLLFEVIDQYGYKIASPTLGNLVFTSTNPLFVSGTFGTPTTQVIDGVTYQALPLQQGTSAANGGSVTIQSISKFTGKTSTYAINANALAAVKSFKMSAPAKIVAEGETVEIPFTAVDQYGNAVTAFDSLNGKITLSSGLAFVKQDDASAKLMFTAPGSGASATVDLPVYLTSVVINGGDFSSLMVSVKDTAVPTAIVGIDSTKATSIAKGNFVDIKAQDLVIQDQYGRTLTDTQVNNWLNTSSANSIVVASDTDAATPFTVKLDNGGSDVASAVIAASSTTAYFVRIEAKTATTDASEAITFTLATGNDGSSPIVASAKTFTFTKVTQSAYASYEVADFGTMYNDGIPGTATNSKWDKAVKVYGVKADGTKVLLPGTDYSVTFDTAKVRAITNSTTGLKDIADVTSSGYANATNSGTDFQNTSGSYENETVNVLVTVNDANGAAASIIEKTLTVSNEDAEVATITVDEDYVTDGKATITAGAISNATFNSANYVYETDDQYGVAITETPVITITGLTKVDGSHLTVSNNGTTSTAIVGAALGDKFTATYKYASGVKVVIEFTVGLDTVTPAALLIGNLTMGTTGFTGTAGEPFTTVKVVADGAAVTATAVASTTVAADGTFAITGLTTTTAYDVYVLDSANNSVKLDVTTN